MLQFKGMDNFMIYLLNFNKYKLTLIFIILLFFSSFINSETFNATFKNVNIQEFISTVGRNLNKTIILSPNIKGTVNVKSYDPLDRQQYYQFFLNVLDVYGYAVIKVDENILKIVRDKDAKVDAVPVNSGAIGDEVVTRIVPVHNIPVKELSPLLRQLNDNAGSGNVVHYEPSNVIMLTGRASVVKKLTKIIQQVDQTGDNEVEVVPLRNASASEMVRIIDALNKSKTSKNTPMYLKPVIVADDRTNAVLLSGDKKVKYRLRKLIYQLDREMATTSNNQVIYLKYAKAEEVAKVLQEVSDNITIEKNKLAGNKGSSGSRNKIKISFHADTNSVVITANPETMKQLKSIVAQLDIRRAQVHVEALIVELDENSLKELGVQMGATQGSFTQFGSASGNGLPFVNYYVGAEALNNGDNGVAAATLGSARGLVLGGVWNDWAVVLNALQQTSNSNIISAPNFTVLDNAEGIISVGEEVPILTGQTLSDDNSNPFNTFERKDVGTKLTVTPQINEGDSVQLKLEQEILRVIPSNAGVGLDTFRTKKLSTSVLIKSGSMIVLGGLIEDREFDRNQKVPVLGDIPVLGALFRGSNTSKIKENTMIFLKPTIIRDDISADGLAQRKYNYLRADQLYNQVFNDSILKQKNSDMVLGDFSTSGDVELPEEIRLFMTYAKDN